MGVLSETWCFCKGVGKSEKLKAALFTGKGPAIARISAVANGVSGTGFLIHRNLLLTAHVNIPSIAAAEGCEIRLQNGVAATLVPHRFFITTSVLDLTIVGLDSVDGESNTQGQQPHYLKTCSKPNLDLGSAVYFLGHTDNEELTVAEGKVVIATDNLIKLSTDGVAWSPGSAGFDAQGNLAFMICDPMKLATSPNTKSSSTSSSSSSSWKKDSPMQFGIPIPVICDWLNQHWEGNLDELTKPKLPIIRLMSTGQKSEHSCASFSLRQVFKSTEADNDGTPSSNTVSKGRDQPNPGCSGTENAVKEGTQTTDSHGAHVQGIPTPEIYESPKLTSGPLRKKESAQIQLLDINFPPRVTKTTVQPHPDILLLPNSNEDSVKEMPSRTREDQIKDKGLAIHEGNADITSTGSVNGAQSEVQSSSSPVKVSEMYNGYSSEGETTMYSAETAESRNYTSPREGKFQQVGRSHSCVSYNRWGTAQRNQVARRAMLEQQRSFIHGRKMYKLTLAKIMARKENPDVSFLEVEKSFYKNKGKAVEIKEVPFDVSMKRKPPNALDGLNLVRPVPKEGFKFQEEDKPESPKIKKSDQPVGKAMNNAKRGVPNVILRKPSLYVEDDVEVRPSRNRVNILPNLTLKMGNDQNKEKFSDMTLLRKPRPMSVDEKQDSGNLRTGVNHDGAGMRVEKEGEDIYSGFTLLKKTETMRIEFKESSETRDASFAEEQEVEDNYISGRQPSEKNNIEFTEEEAALNQQSDSNLVDSAVNISMEASLQGKPKRLDHYVEATSASRVEDLNLANPENLGNANEDAPSISPLEDADWKRAEDLLRTGDRVEVELISFSARGFIVSFGSLVGFLPYRNLAARWKFLAFESWLKQKGLDPSLYKKSLGIIGSYNVLERNSSLDSSIVPNTDRKIEVENKPDMKLEDLLMIYDQEKLKFLSSFVGQKIKVNVVIAERKLRKLVVSLRPKEKEELVEKKRHLMATLQIGDVVKCCIKKVTYFGIFVEVEGVPALIHASEVSWDATLNPASCFKVGQIVEAKVHQLDFTLQRIFLSLKEITPDPLIETLESVFGGRAPLDGKLQEAEADSEWADVETLVKELQQIEGIQSVSRGRFFLSPGLAPAFQVYMASMFENQYKLLARSGNKVQEVIVQASLSKEEMKSTILSCANRVE